FSGLTIQYGLFSTGVDSTKDGAGIRNLNTGTVTLTNCKVSRNNTVDPDCSCGSSVGGGIANTGTGTVNVIGSTVNDNGADLGGGGIANSSTGVVNITSSYILENGADLGGGLFNPDIGTMNVTDSTVANNNICDFCLGNGIYNGAGITNVTNSTVSQNGVVL